MLQVKNNLHSDEDSKNHISDFTEEGTVAKANIEDNIESLQQSHDIHHKEGKGQKIISINLKLRKANRIEVEALFCSIKCFEFLMMNAMKLTKTM